MYDEIIVKQDLPLPNEIRHLKINWNDYVFQTKCLDSCLSTYIIENNLLSEKITERQYIEFSEKEKKQRKRKNVVFPIWKDVIETQSYPKLIEDFHGTITFYTSDELNDTEDFWVDFKAYFVYGKLDKIELVKFDTHPSRKHSLDDIKTLIVQTQTCPWNIFKRYASYAGWRLFWKCISASLSFVSEQCQSTRMFIIRYCL